MLVDLEGSSGSASIINPILESKNKIIKFNGRNKYKILKQQTKIKKWYDHWDEVWGERKIRLLVLQKFT